MNSTPNDKTTGCPVKPTGADPQAAVSVFAGRLFQAVVVAKTADLDALKRASYVFTASSGWCSISMRSL